jgi:hypothetical protein
MLKEVTKWLMQWFMSHGLTSEAALVTTIFVIIIGIVVLVIIADKVIRSRMCRPLRRYINEIYKEDDTYGPDNEG